MKPFFDENEAIETRVYCEVRSWGTVYCGKRLNKAIEEFFDVILFILLCEVIVTFRSVDENPVCNYSNERFWALFSRGIVPKSRPSISKTNVLYILAVNVNVAFAVRLPVVLNHYFFPSQVWKFWYSRREDLKITFASKLT